MRPIRFALASALCAALAACGGVRDTTPASTSEGAASTIASGTVSGFGSVIVDGQHYDDSLARVLVETDPARADEAVLTRVRLGMQVEVDATTGADGDSARTILVESTVAGRVQSVSVDSIVVASQTVKASSDPLAPTFFEGAGGLAELSSGDRVEVHGQRDANGAIIATRIERKDPRSAELTRVVGVVSGFDASGKSFTIGGLVVGFGDATRIVPAGDTLADGRLVAVYSDQPMAGNRLDATAIKVKRRALEASRLLRIGGRIRLVDATTPSFMLDGMMVDASAASFPYGGPRDLATGVWVRVLGSFDGAAIKARVVKLRRQGDEDIDVSLFGPVREFVSSADFKVRGVPIDASAASTRFVNGTAADLVNGRSVRITGEVQGNVVRAKLVTFGLATLPAPGAVVVDRVRLAGIVRTVDGSPGRILIGATAVRFDGATVFVGGALNLRSGANVEVEGRIVAGELVAARIEIEDPNGNQGAAVRGAIGEFGSVADFRVLGQRVDASGASFDGGTAADLRIGAEVDVRGTLVDGVLRANQVSFRG